MDFSPKNTNAMKPSQRQVHTTVIRDYHHAKESHYTRNNIVQVGREVAILIESCCLHWH